MTVLLILSILIMVISVVSTYSNGDEEEDEYFGEDLAKSFGSLAWGGGLLLNILFVVVNRSRKIFKLKIPIKLILNIHIATNILLAFLAILHGYAFIEAAGPIEYLSILLIIVLLVSGILLRYTSTRDLKLLNRLIHGQLILSIILALVIGLHVIYIED